MMRQAGSDGFIIVAVLWLLAALATFASIYATYVIDTAVAFRTYDDRLQAEALVRGAIELAAYQLTSNAERHPTHGEFNFRMGQANVAVDFRSESARIDLNAAPKELLLGLFEALGARRADADRYADRTIAWRTKPVQGQNSEASASKAGDPPYALRGAPFPAVEELGLALDLPTEFLERALPLVTVYSGLGKIDVFEAAPEVIGSLPEITQDRLNAVLAQRQATPGDGQALLSLLGRAQTYVSTEASKASRVTVHIAFDDGLRTSSEVVILAYEKGNAPYSVLSWRDHLDGLPAHDGLGRGAR